MTINASQVVATIGAPLALTTTTGTTGAGLGTVLGSVSGSVLALHDIQLQFVAGTAATRVYLKAGTVSFRDVYLGEVGDGLIFVPPPGKEIRLTTSQPFVLDNTGGTVAYTVRSTVEASL